MTILCQILQLMNLLHRHMFIHHLCLPCHCMFVHHPSCFLVIHQAVQCQLQILADLAEAGVEQLEPEPEAEAEEQVVFEDQTLEEIDILVSGAQRPTAIKFKPLSLFCRKPTGARLGINVGKQKGLKRNSGLNFTGLSKVCGHDFEVKSIGGDGNCFFRMISYLLFGVED